MDDFHDHGLLDDEGDDFESGGLLAEGNDLPDDGLLGEGDDFDDPDLLLEGVEPEYPVRVGPMRTLFARMKSLAGRPFWTEGPVQKKRRRAQLLLSMPFVLLGGMTWGFFAAPIIGEGSQLFWTILGAATFGVLFYLEQMLLPMVAAMADRVGLSALAALVWEVGVVGGLMFLFTSVLGAPVIPAVTLAIAVGVIYSLSAEYLVFGSAADHIANLLGMGRGWSGARGSDYSLAEALEKRGDLGAAEEIYKEAMGKNRRDPVPYLRLARLRTRRGLHEEAIDILRRALGVARFSDQGEALAVREIHEIFSTRLGDGSRAAPDLARYLEGQPEGANGEWARRELAYIKERIQLDE